MDCHRAPVLCPSPPVWQLAHWQPQAQWHTASVLGQHHLPGNHCGIAPSVRLPIPRLVLPHGQPHPGPALLCQLLPAVLLRLCSRHVAGSDSRNCCGVLCGAAGSAGSRTLHL
ncbi:unnamed protein product, partial [Closterium sp. NIES-53]